MRFSALHNLAPPVKMGFSAPRTPPVFNRTSFWVSKFYIPTLWKSKYCKLCGSSVEFARICGVICNSTCFLGVKFCLADYILIISIMFSNLYKYLLAAFLGYSSSLLAGVISIENDWLARSWSIENGRLTALKIENHAAGRFLDVQNVGVEEFRLRISRDLNDPDPDRILTAQDFIVTRVDEFFGSGVQSVDFSMRCSAPAMLVKLHFELRGSDRWLRKSLSVTALEPGWFLERVDVESLQIADANAPYTQSQITAQGPSEWRPGLGQPIYTKDSGLFLGVEFPAAWNQVSPEGDVLCGYLHGYELIPGETFQSFPAVMGVTEDPAFVQESFYEYIDSIRAQPLRLQIQYNSWFDYGPGVNRERFSNSVSEIHEQLVHDRGVSPFKAYVIDDGWQDTRDWTDTVWKVNGKFDPDLKTSRYAVQKAESRLGIWLSPGCLFGASSAIPAMKEAGLESIDPWMSMAGPKYMALLEKRLVELTRAGTGYFKLDGVFGHLNIRNFEVHGERYGLPTLSRILPEDIRGSDRRLNDSKYDEHKVYYFSAGTLRLMQLFNAMREVNPEVYIVISNGAWLSPWWLSYVDAVWMINAGDAAGGSSRTEELVYRDGVYQGLVEEDQTQYPLNSIFNHEPKKTSSRETKEQFRNYLYMNLSRGTGFIELYIKTFELKDYDWDVLAEGLIWAERMFPAFQHVCMHGGSPTAGAVYGYTGWNREGNLGFVSIHNPSEKSQRYMFQLDRAFGLSRNAARPGKSFRLSSPMESSMAGITEIAEVGQRIQITLQPGEVRLICLCEEGKSLDWSDLKNLQTRTDSDYVTPKPVPVDGHPILGVWEYEWAGSIHTREFTSDGICILKSGDAVQWRKPFRVMSDKELLVEESYAHVLQPDGILMIEGRYRAKRSQD